MSVITQYESSSPMKATNIIFLAFHFLSATHEIDFHDLNLYSTL